MYEVSPSAEEHQIFQPASDLCWSILGYMLKTSARSGLLLGALYGTTVMPLIGTLYGAVMGLVGGLLLGVAGGLVLGVVTQAWFYPRTKLELYGKVMQVTVSGVNILGGLLIGLWLPGEGDVALEVASEGLPHIVLVLTGRHVEAHWILLPTVIAALAPLFWRPRYVRWYVAHM